MDPGEIGELCDCAAFNLWYAEEYAGRVCYCGHQDVDHLLRRRSCTGEVERLSPERIGRLFDVPPELLGPFDTLPPGGVR